jgi:hypothetical protein
MSQLLFSQALDWAKMQCARNKLFATEARVTEARATEARATEARAAEAWVTEARVAEARGKASSDGLSTALARMLRWRFVVAICTGDLWRRFGEHMRDPHRRASIFRWPVQSLERPAVIFGNRFA